MPLKGGTYDKPVAGVYLFTGKFFLEVITNSEVKMLSSLFLSILTLPLTVVIK